MWVLAQIALVCNLTFNDTRITTLEQCTSELELDYLNLGHLIKFLVHFLNTFLIEMSRGCDSPATFRVINLVNYFFMYFLPSLMTRPL